jgi:hypothetical protein
MKRGPRVGLPKRATHCTRRTPFRLERTKHPLKTRGSLVYKKLCLVETMEHPVERMLLLVERKLCLVEKRRSLVEKKLCLVEKTSFLLDRMELYFELW